MSNYFSSLALCYLIFSQFCFLLDKEIAASSSDAILLSIPASGGWRNGYLQRSDISCTLNPSLANTKIAEIIGARTNTNFTDCVPAISACFFLRQCFFGSQSHADSGRPCLLKKSFCLYLAAHSPHNEMVHVCLLAKDFVSAQSVKFSSIKWKKKHCANNGVEFIQPKKNIHMYFLFNFSPRHFFNIEACFGPVTSPIMTKNNQML